MGYLMGIDLGTSSIKVMLMSEDGIELAVARQSYDISIPSQGYAQQKPDMWYEKTIQSIRDCISRACVPAAEILALGFSGQMHGLVCVDEYGQAVCPAIIWPDTRTRDVIREMEMQLGREYMAEHLQNAISTGTLVASLYWMKKNQPEHFKRINKVMLPKDYIKMKLSGVAVTDYSDAAGSLAFNNRELRWSKELIETLGLPYEYFPPCKPSAYVVGTISKLAAQQTGLSVHTKVVNGGADQCMQGIGNGITEEGIFSSNIGTGGQMSACFSKPVHDQYLRTNTFAHSIDGKWNIMGACLSSGASFQWLRDRIIADRDTESINTQCGKIPCGSEGLIFLPYLSGERTPYHNPNARGMFFGLMLNHNQYHMARAVMEGVVYSLNDCLLILRGMGMECRKVVASGGGAKSEVWLQIQADVYNQEIYKTMSDEQACLGAVMTAGVGIGIYKGYADACAQVVRYDKKIYEPKQEHVRIYKEYFELYQELYRCNSKYFDRILSI